MTMSEEKRIPTVCRACQRVMWADEVDADGRCPNCPKPANYIDPFGLDKKKKTVSDADPR